MRRTDIDWATHVWNPIKGCLGPTGTVEFPAPCSFCYAKTLLHRFGAYLGCQQCADFTPHLHEGELEEPQGRGHKIVFAGSVTDLLSAGVKQEWRDAMWRVMLANPQNQYIVLTKRPQEITRRDASHILRAENLWVGVSATNQREYLKRMMSLLDACVPWGRTLLSLEPLLEIVHVEPTLRPSWVIIGPMTGQRAQVPHSNAAAITVSSFSHSGVPVWMKRSSEKAWPEWPAGWEYPQERPDAMLL